MNDILWIVLGIIVGANGGLLLYAICALNAINHAEKEEQKYLKDMR